MNTLFNISDFTLTAHAQPRSTRCSANKTSKISRPLSQGSTICKKQAQRALKIALASISTLYCSQAAVISKEAYSNGTAQVIAEIWEDGENVLCQFDIDENGYFTEIRL